MADFNRLMRLLEQEILCQERLLDILARERAAIVQLNQEQIEQFNQKKYRVLADVHEVAEKRDKVISALVGDVKSKTPLKLSDIIERCPVPEIRRKLETIGNELRTAATSVNEMNRQNSELIKQSLGLVATTIAIFRGFPGKDLPTYNASGALRSPSMPTARPAGSIVRDA